jgi:VWFA-related protein
MGSADERLSMKRRRVLLAALALLPALRIVTSAQRQTASVDLVEIDASVIDDDGRPVAGLKQGDFSVREDGRRVAITTFSEVRGPQPDDPDAARTIVVLLDDSGVAPSGTATMQTIARAVLSRAGRYDEVPIVRLHTRADEPYGDRATGELRIREYRAGGFPFVFWETSRDTLDRIAGIARQIAPNAGRRKIVICVGAPFVCNPDEPSANAPRSFWGSWVRALTDLAQANAALYALIPAHGRVRRSGLADLSGGEVFTAPSDVGPPIDRVLRDAANYYVVGYWPEGKAQELHRIEVKVMRKGVRVLARKRRGY